MSFSVQDISAIIKNNETNNSFSISFNDISNENSHHIVDFPNFVNIIREINRIFNEEIKTIKENFSIDKYEKSVLELRNMIINLRRIYYQNNQNQTQNQAQINTQTQINTQSQVAKPGQMQPPSSEFTNINSTTANNNFNPSKNFTNDKTLTASNIKINNNLDNEGGKKRVNNAMYESAYSQNGLFDNNIKSPKSINYIYNKMIDIAFYIMSNDDIYINYENKSAYVTLKLFLQMSTMHFFKNIKKEDFILCLMNKSCNILCKYNDMQHKDENIKKILTLGVKELEKLNKIFEWDLKLIKYINNTKAKINNEIKKFDLVYKAEKVKDDLVSNKLFNNEKNKIIIDKKDEMQIKIDKLNEEKNLLNDIQKDLGKDYQIYLKESVRNELNQFNILINKISQYDNPLIKEKFLDIIIRNKDVFNYINDNILIPHLSKYQIENLNLYPFNKSLNVYVDKYIVIGKKILEILSIPIEQDYLNIIKEIEKFGKNFLGTLSKASNKEENEKNEEKNENNEIFKYEIDYYHLTLFAFMLTSKLGKKEYFNRISALITTKMKFEDLRGLLNSIENIKNIEYNYESKKEGAEDEGGAMILFDYVNNTKNIISFFLVKRHEQKKIKKKIDPFTDLEICSILAKKIFENDPIIIILTISLKYWAIERKIFKNDFKIRINPKEVLDDSVLLYLIYYFLMHKGIIEPFIGINKQIKKEEENKDKIENNTKYSLKDNPLLIKQLGELFTEFFWFVHELICMAENDIKNKNIKNKKTKCINLNSKNYSNSELEMKDIEKNKIKDKVPIPLKLMVDERVLDKLDIKETNILKRECTRALYFLLSKDAETLFTFEKKQ